MRGLEPHAQAMRCARDGRNVPEAAAAGDDPAAWVAVDLGHDAAAMGVMLRELRGQGHAVQGFVDRSTALAGAHRLTGTQLAIDLAPGQTLLSVVSRDGAVAQLQRTVRLPGGASRLIDAWLELAARTLVQQTRFDPLHDRRCEQELRAALPALAAEADRNGQVEHRVRTAGQELPLIFTRDQLVTAAAPQLQPVAAALQALVAGLPDCGLLVDEKFSAVPGAVAVLEAAHVAQVRVVAAGAAACAASLLPAAAPLAAGGVEYLTRIEIQDGPMPDSLPLLAVAGDDQRPLATHVVYRGRAIPIDGNGLVIGRDPGAASAVLALPEGVAGVSRRHCTLRSERGRAQIVDHSQYGSFVDGARVRGRAFLAAGSMLRLGTPGIELPLVWLQPD